MRWPYASLQYATLSSMPSPFFSSSPSLSSCLPRLSSGPGTYCTSRAHSHTHSSANCSRSRLTKSIFSRSTEMQMQKKYLSLVRRTDVLLVCVVRSIWTLLLFARPWGRESRVATYRVSRLALVTLISIASHRISSAGLIDAFVEAKKGRARGYTHACSVSLLLYPHSRHVRVSICALGCAYAPSLKLVCITEPDEPPIRLSDVVLHIRLSS